VTRLQSIILVLLGLGILAVMAGVAYLLLQAPAPDSAGVLPQATVPPHPLLLTRAPLCRDAVGAELAARGWAGTVELDAQNAQLVVALDPLPDVGPDEVPAGQIWGAFEAALVGGSACGGYEAVVVRVSGFRAQVAADDLTAWASGALDDAAFSDRVLLTQPAE